MGFKIERMFVGKTFTPYDATMLHLKSLGRIRAIGNGAFCTVYSVSGIPDVVFKIGKIESNINGYWPFIEELSRQKTDNTFLPKIFSVLVFGKGCDRVFLAKMERLKKIRSTKHVHAVSWFTSFLYSQVFTPYRDGAGAEVFNVTYRVPTTLRLAVDLIKRTVHKSSKRGRNIQLDIHDDNLMLRGTQIVITDPVC